MDLYGKLIGLSIPFIKENFVKRLGIYAVQAAAEN